MSSVSTRWASSIEVFPSPKVSNKNVSKTKTVST